MPLLKDIKAQMPNVACQTTSMNNSTNLIVNRDAPPFDNAELRRAVMLAMDRKASVDILNQGDAQRRHHAAGNGGRLGPAPKMYDRCRATGATSEEPRGSPRHHEEAGLRPRQSACRSRSRRAASRSTRIRRSSASQLKEIWIDADVDIIETSQWFPQVAQKKYSLGLNTTRATASTTPTRTTTRTSPASRNATTPVTAIRKSRSCSTPSRPRPTWRNARDRLGNRSQAVRGRCAAHHHVEPRVDLHAALREGLRRERQQRLQRLPLRGTSGSTSDQAPSSVIGEVARRAGQRGRPRVQGVSDVGPPNNPATGLSPPPAPAGAPDYGRQVRGQSLTGGGPAAAVDPGCPGVEALVTLRRPVRARPNSGDAATPLFQRFRLSPIARTPLANLLANDG